MEIILVLGGIVFFWVVANAIGGHREYNNQTGGSYPANNGYNVDGEGGDGAQWQQYTACPMCVASRNNQITGAYSAYARPSPPRSHEVEQNEQTGWQVFRPNEHTAKPEAEWMPAKRN